MSSPFLFASRSAQGLCTLGMISTCFLPLLIHVTWTSHLCLATVLRLHWHIVLKWSTVDFAIWLNWTDARWIGCIWRNHRFWNTSRIGGWGWKTERSGDPHRESKPSAHRHRTARIARTTRQINGAMSFLVARANWGGFSFSPGWSRNNAPSPGCPFVH